MGRIETKGIAKREVEYDRMVVSLTFHARETKSKDALRKVSEECESFLGTLEGIGLDIRKMRGGENSLSEESSYHGKNEFAASRELSWECKYDLGLTEAIMHLAEAESYNVDINFTPRYSELETLHKELLREAAIDAREQAEMLAASLGEKIKGPHSVIASSRSVYAFEDCPPLEDLSIGGAGVTDALVGSYATLQSPTTREMEQITIKWDLEKEEK